MARLGQLDALANKQRQFTETLPQHMVKVVLAAWLWIYYQPEAPARVMITSLKGEF